MTAVLITRPQPQAKAFAQAVEARFGAQATCVISPVLQVVPLTPDIDFTAFGSVAFTSQNAVQAYDRLGGPRDMMAYCVGDKTAQAAMALGLQARSAGGDIAALNALLNAEPPKVPVLHLSGVHVAGKVTQAAQRVAVYDQQRMGLTPQARDILSKPGPVLVPLFSARSGAALQASLPMDAAARMHAICLSPSVAKAVDGARFRNISTSDAPTLGAILDKMASFFPV